MNNKKTQINWGELFVGILLVFLGAMTLNNPFSNLIGFTLLIGLAGIIKGVLLLMGYFGFKKATDYHAVPILLMGIIDFVFGLILVFNLGIGVGVLPFLFAIWFIISSIIRLTHAYEARTSGTGYYWFIVIINVIGILLGVMLLGNPFTSALTLSFLISFYFFLFGIIYVLDSFMGQKNSKY